MFRRKGRAQSALDEARPYAERLAEDEEAQQQALTAAAEAGAARRRLFPSRRASDVAYRLAMDKELRTHLLASAVALGQLADRLQQRPQRRRRRRLLMVAGVAGGAVLVHPRARAGIRRWLSGAVSGAPDRLRETAASGPSTIAQSIVVDVPVSMAYNQWTQFEEFPRFMDGVEQVRQLDDTLLHWAAAIGGKRREWDAKIVEQTPDRVIAWRSTDGKENSGRVVFTPLDENRTRIDVTMTYTPEGVRERAAATAGVDERKVKGDLERFKEFIEARMAETGGWRGEIHAGQSRQ